MRNAWETGRPATALYPPLTSTPSNVRLWRESSKAAFSATIPPIFGTKVFAAVSWFLAAEIRPRIVTRLTTVAPLVTTGVSFNAEIIRITSATKMRRGTMMTPTSITSLNAEMRGISCAEMAVNAFTKPCSATDTNNARMHPMKTNIDAASVRKAAVYVHYNRISRWSKGFLQNIDLIFYIQWTPLNPGILFYIYIIYLNNARIKACGDKSCFEKLQKLDFYIETPWISCVSRYQKRVQRRMLKISASQQVMRIVHHLVVVLLLLLVALDVKFKITSSSRTGQQIVSGCREGC